MVVRARMRERPLCVCFASLVLCWVASTLQSPSPWDLVACVEFHARAPPPPSTNTKVMLRTPAPPEPARYLCQPPPPQIGGIGVWTDTLSTCVHVETSGRHGYSCPWPLFMQFCATPPASGGSVMLSSSHTRTTHVV